MIEFAIQSEDEVSDISAIAIQQLVADTVEAATGMVSLCLPPTPCNKAARARAFRIWTQETCAESIG
jgi:hypothetical protein